MPMSAATAPKQPMISRPLQGMVAELSELAVAVALSALALALTALPWQLPPLARAFPTSPGVQGQDRFPSSCHG